MEAYVTSQGIYKRRKSDQSINQLNNVNLLQQFLAFQSTFISFNILFPILTKFLSIFQHNVIS